MCVEALVKIRAFLEGNWGAQGTDALAGGHQFKSSLVEVVTKNDN